MASASSSSIKIDGTDVLYSTVDSDSLFTSGYQTSLEHVLPNSADQILPTSAPIDVGKLVSTSDDTTLDLLQGFSAPASTVYINMNANESANTINVINPITTTDQLLPRSLTTTSTDHLMAPTTAVSKQSDLHHHHFPHHQQNRNRYPYLQRPSLAKGHDRGQGTSQSHDSLYYEHRPAFRRAYFALRRQRIPKAPPMPMHFFPGYKQSRVALSPTGKTGESAEDADEEDQLPSKSTWVILRLVFFFFAIEFMYAVETALTVPILTSLRVPESFYSMAWLISPILGFFLQPIVGMWSDTCKCRWGRRRPFILAFAIGAFIGITLLLNSSDLGIALGDPTEPGTIPYKAIILTAIGVTFLDFCADSADAPVRAYLIDTTNIADQERGFNIHAILGIGGGLGYGIGAINWPYIPMFHKGGGEFSIVFYFAAFLFIVCSISTLTSVREEPLISSSSKSLSRDQKVKDNLNDDEQNEVENNEKRPLLTLRPKHSRSYNTNNRNVSSTANGYLDDLTSKEGFIEIDPATGTRIPHDDVERTSEDILLQTMERSHQIVAASLANTNNSESSSVPTQAFETELRQKAKLVKLGLMRRNEEPEETEDIEERDKVTIKSMLISMIRMPPRLWKLMICQVIGWIAYFATHLYFTDFVATEVYNGTFEHKEDPGFDRYKQGVAMGCWGLLVYSATTAIYAFCLERWLAEKFSLKTLYFIGYLAYAVGCLIDYFVHNIVVNIIMCATFSMLVVSLNTLPYHMLSQFHADETYRNSNGSKRGIGIDCSLLNSCYFLGELFVAAGLGPILERTGVNTCMLIGTGFALLGSVTMVILFKFKT